MGTAPGTAWRGHSVLQLPVPPLEEWVRERTRHHDPAFVSADPDFGHAHITALAPFAADPDEETLARVAEVAAATDPIRVRLARLAIFPNGIIHLRVEPAGPLRELTGALVAAFPRFVPYEGRFGPDPEPHLTLDALSEHVSLRSTGERLGNLLPATCTLDELQLAWWEADHCRVLRRWPLGPDRPHPAHPLPLSPIIL